MNDTLQNLSNWWQQLEDRQQRTLSFALPIIFLLVLFLLMQPLLSHYQQSKQRHQKIVTSYKWLAEQSALTTSAPKSCGDLSLMTNNPEFQQILNQQLNDRQILDPKWTQSADGWQLTLREVNGSELLTWLEQVTCQGIVLKSMSMHRTVLDDQSSDWLDATIELEVL